MTYVRDLLDRRGDIELEFVRRLGATSVHVAMPEDPDVEPELVDSSDWTEEQKFEAYLSICRRTVLTLCGRVVRVYFDDSGPCRMVGTFADADLCWSCHRALGPVHASRAFEHPRPSDRP